MEELIPQLKAQIIDCLNIEGMDPQELDADMPLFGDVTGLDSIDALELVLLLDKQYGIKITDSKKARKIMVNIRTIAEYIQENAKP
ncbi:MAG: acyl carrier protein [Deltaproteobacteria bacterium]|nr:acyl carrier protein [Deltaproteobacteria bacterium]